ncbi:hypothetical protein Tco_0708973 [Tanacetum coccineum]
MEPVFEICKCAEDDKVKFAMCMFEGRALTWWNGNVQTLGLANANQITRARAKALRIGDSNQRKWADQQGNNYRQQPKPQVKKLLWFYVAAPAKG